MITKNTLRTFFVLAIFAISVLILAKLAEKKKRNFQTLSRSVPLMGTILEIKLYGQEKDLSSAADLAIEEIRRIENVFSIFGDGEAVKLNKEAGDIPFKCSDEMWHILKESEKFYKLSNNAFDVSIRPMMLLWGFYKKRQEIPSDDEIKETLQQIGFDKLQLNEENKSILFKNKNSSLDFGGIVKGYAVDCAVAKLERKGINSGIVNLGGNIRTLESPPPGKLFYDIGIRHPIKKDEICTIAKISGAKALATSGNYERYVILENKHITHIINPVNGRPVENMLSVTVIAPDAITADALSTSVFVMGEELAKKISEQNQEIEFLIIKRLPTGDIKKIKIGKTWTKISL
jgi:thiamine biosynthesis lipoprotein